MRKPLLLMLCIALAAAAAEPAVPASADSVSSRLRSAKDRQARAREDVAATKGRLALLHRQYAAALADLQAAEADVLTAYVARLSAQAQLGEAQHQLDEQAAEAYEYGPGIAVEAFLGSRTSSDYASAQEFAAHALDAGSQRVSQVVALKASLDAAGARLGAVQSGLAAKAGRLQELAAQIGAELATARADARAAGLSVAKIAEEEAALAASQSAAAASLAGLVGSERGVDQSALLALLGPNGGKGCDLPSGLRLTGTVIGGQSSWYGPGFAGQATASGAIFDPSLFTAANLTLPLNSFVRIHYQGRCAIVLVNDRGPYGVAGRVFDVAEAVAEYLGYRSAGVADVTADVLAPTG